MELFRYSAGELSRMIKSKECSSVEITNSVLKRIEATEPQIGAYVTVTPEEALKKAKEVDEKIARGEILSPLAGIPMGIKDNICQKGTLTTCSSKMLSNFISPYDATVIEHLRQNDVVFTGKLNMDEFAMGSTCETSYYKKTKNPRNLQHVPGGSSGGSAASVAAGSAVLSIGSDTGGSVRCPAAWCGLVGLKPTYGAVSRYGLIAFASSLDQIGPITRTTEDNALLFNALCGADERDATSSKIDHPDYTSFLNGSIKGLKIGLPKEYFGEGLNPLARKKIDGAVEALKAAGAIISEISLPSTGDALPAYYIISSAEASSNLSRFDGIKYGYRSENYSDLVDLYVKSRSEGFGDEVKRRIMLGTFVLSSGFFDAYYGRAKKLQRQIQGEFDKAFNSCDLILTPTSPFTAFKFGENAGNPIGNYLADLCTVTVNIAGLPAISVPCGAIDNGLPVGMQLIAPKFREDLLFNVSSCYEKMTGGFMPVADIE
ncbi:MAG: Asp-tRNA(Asn)/Glu-tRNA(Gln) amidotransferase subunit GatA [Oscillospiraceae bacterium]